MPDTLLQGPGEVGTGVKSLDRNLGDVHTVVK